jgi:WD40 repeat protein
MASVEVHPSAEELAAFTLGTLDGEAHAPIEVHVASCACCQERAATAPGDPFVELLRRVHGGTGPGTATVAETAAEVQTPAPSARAAQTVTLAPAIAPSAPVESVRPEVPDALLANLAHHERYRVVRLLGEGGMGSVYEAEHLVMQRAVALKVINPAYTACPAALERFRREARAAARLAHPNIVTTYDAEDAGATHFLVMEYAEGVSLGRLVKERGPLPVAEACGYIRQAALGLQHAHERGMVHRDVKPDNLIRCADGTVKVLDFGLASLTAEGSGGLTEANVVMGTPDYMAPEQAEDLRSADIRADVYSLGCTLYYLLTASVPYPAATPMLKILAHREQQPPPIRQARPAVPPELAAVVARMLAKKPAVRYQTPGEVASALQPFVHASATLPARKRYPLLVTVTLAALFTGLLVAGGVVYRIQSDKGELVITTESDDVEVVIKQGGRLVRVIDTKADKEITLALRSGTYELELKGASEGLKLDIDRATLTRGETVLARIERTKKRPPKTLGEVRRFEGHEGSIRAVAYSPDGRYVLSASGWPKPDGTIRLWDVASGKEVRRFEGRIGDVASVAFSPDGRQALSAGTEGVALWDVASGKEVRRLEGHDGWVASVAFCPDGRHALSGGYDATVRLWNLATGDEIRKFLGHESWVVSLAVSPDGGHAASGSLDKTVRVWELESGKEVKRLEGPTRFGNNFVAYSPDGRFLLSGWPDGSVRLWEVKTGKEVRSFAGHPSPDAGVGGVAFSPDGRRAVSGGGGDKTLRLWDVETGKQLACFAGHDDAIWGVAFSPDGRYALSGSGGRCRGEQWTAGCDWTLRLWRLPEQPAAKDKP